MKTNWVGNVITYKETIKVYLDGKLVGNIIRLPANAIGTFGRDNMYQYFPKRSKQGGIIGTLAMVKASIEGKGSFSA